MELQWKRALRSLNVPDPHHPRIISAAIKGAMEGLDTMLQACSALLAITRRLYLCSAKSKTFVIGWGCSGRAVKAPAGYKVSGPGSIPAALTSKDSLMTIWGLVINTPKLRASVLGNPGLYIYIYIYKFHLPG